MDEAELLDDLKRIAFGPVCEHGREEPHYLPLRGHPDVTDYCPGPVEGTPDALL